jgi:hypothetical protein
VPVVKLTLFVDPFSHQVKVVDSYHTKYKCLRSKKDVVIYSSDGIAIFYLFQGGMDMDWKDKDRPVSLKSECHLYSSFASYNPPFPII